MQSIPQVSENFHKQKILLNSKNKTVSVIPKISQPNNLLPQKLLLSKPVSHFFHQNFNDIKAQSGSSHKLYEPSSNSNSRQNPPIFSYENYSKKQTIKKEQKNQFKFQNLKHFLLFQSQKIIFITRSVCLTLNQQQKKVFNNLISFNLSRSIKNQQNILSYKEQIQQLTKILLQKKQFPFLCSELNQTITQKSSLQNLLLQSTQECLIFDDNFQSSNILMVKKIENLNSQKPIYCICTRFDYQTASYGQWFYFSVQWLKNQKQVTLSERYETEKCKKFKFVICNMTKQYSLFGSSMKISVCRKGIWGKQGQNIQYYQTVFHRFNKTSNQDISLDDYKNKKNNHQFYFALEFDLELKKGQKIYVSYNQPYTVSRLSNLLDGFHKIYTQILNGNKKINTFEEPKTYDYSPNKKFTDFHTTEDKVKITDKQPVYYKRQVISETPLKNEILCLTFSIRKQFTSKSILQQSRSIHKNNHNKQIIFILARAHPIQTAGSFVTEGIIKDLFLFTEFKNNEKRRTDLRQYFEQQNKGKLLQNLLKNFIIKIVPILNPDGVIIGNSRCNFHGYDLNRQWKRSNKVFSKEIFSLKRFLLKFKGRIQMVIDLHGHSKQKNVFAYGLHNFKDPFATRQFPYILSKIVTNNFSFNQCKFTRLKNQTKYRQSIEKKTPQSDGKQGTARIWLYRKLQIPNIFTIQNSYCGSTKSMFHYDNFSYNQIGKQILKGICLYYLDCQKRENIQKDEGDFEGQKSNQILIENCELNELIRFKNSLISGMKQNDANASVGLDEINSSQSEEELRIQDEIKHFKTKNQSPQKRKLLSPNKITGQDPLKKPFQSAQKLKKIQSIISNQRFSNHLKSSDEQIHNFQYKSNQKIQTNHKSQVPIKNEKSIITLNRRYSRNQIHSQSKSRFQESQYQKKSVSNHKSTNQLQRNTALSIVQVGWDQSKVIEGKICQTERVYLNNLQYNNLLNFPQISSSGINNIIFTHRSNLSLKYKLFNNKNSLLNSQQKQEAQKISEKIQLGNLGEDTLQKVQLKKNVNEFIKKLESNRKLQNEMVLTRKIQKYKEIIKKINGNKNN